MKAIRTKSLGPTNTKGARVVARVEGLAPLTVPWDYARSTANNHAAAARALLEKLDWRDSFATGCLADGSYVHVLLDEAPADPLAVACPACHAPTHAVCRTLPGKQGPAFRDFPHVQRVTVAKARRA